MALESGETLGGKYELIEVAGEGGMASVYRARTLGAAGFRRPVAVKRLLPAPSGNPEFVQMFVEEARVASELQHPNIVQIHDFDRDESGAYFLVMEWVEGMNLLDWAIAHRRVKVDTPWPLVAAIGIEVLKALTAAHERTNESDEVLPVFHRDVTPQNVMLSVSGVAKLTDFGLARAMDRARITQPHVVKGKISYLAPELTFGEEANAQTDIFAMGVVLWEVLAGGKLFRGEAPLQIVRAIREDAVPSVSTRRRDVPEELCAVIASALAKDPTQRFSSARAMTRALSNILRATPLSTGSDVLGESVREARRWLAKPRNDEAQSANVTEPERSSVSLTIEYEDEEEAHVLLTRRRGAPKPAAEH